MKALIIALMGQETRALNVAWLRQALVGGGYEPEIVEALDKNSRDFRWIRVSEDACLTAGEQAAAESHRRAMQRVIELGEPALVFEDDAWFQKCPPKEWFEGVEHVMTCGDYPNNHPENDLGSHEVHLEEDNEVRFKAKNYPWGAHCYYATPEAARIILNESQPILWAADILLNKIVEQGKMTAYVAKHTCVNQHLTITSHIGDR